MNNFKIIGVTGAKTLEICLIQPGNDNLGTFRGKQGKIIRRIDMNALICVLFPQSPLFAIFQIHHVFTPLKVSADETLINWTLGRTPYSHPKPAPQIFFNREACEVFAF
jgi:hypothetical protein